MENNSVPTELGFYLILLGQVRWDSDPHPQNIIGGRIRRTVHKFIVGFGKPGFPLRHGRVAELLQPNPTEQ